MKRKSLFALITVALSLAAAAQAQLYETADELIAAMESQPEPATTEATLSMTIDTGGQSLTRVIQMWAAGDDRRVMKFTAPADIAGSGFLTITLQNGAEEKLVYLPAVGRVRRIAGGQEGDAFFGSDFSYADVTGFDPDDYRLKLLEVTDGPTYVVEAVPLAEAAGGHDRLVITVPESSMVPTRMEYYRGDEVVKVLTVGGLTEVDGYTVALERRMETLAGDQVRSFTVITQSDLKLDQPLPDELFTERFLVR